MTPLLQGGAAIDEDAFAPLVERYVTAGLDGVLAFGTNGEGVLFSVAERQRGLRLFVEAAAGRLASRPTAVPRRRQTRWRSPPMHWKRERRPSP